MTEFFGCCHRVSISTSPAEFTSFIKSEIAKWGKVVKASGTPID